MALALLQEELNYKKESATEMTNYAERYIDSFISMKKVGSNATANTYKSAIKLFCKVVFDKDVQFVTVDEFKMVSGETLSNYIIHLSNETKKDGSKKYKNKSINTKFRAIQSLYNYLVSVFPDINLNIFKGITLPDPDLDCESWDAFEWMEVEAMIEYASTDLDVVADMKTKEKKVEDRGQMSMLIMLGATTSIRLEALLSLEWDKHFKIKFEDGGYVDYIDVVDKNERHVKSLCPEDITELKSNLGESGKLFPSLYPDKVRDYIKQLIDVLNIDKRRKLSFHSLKKSGVNRAIDLTGDILVAQQQGNHKDVNTTVKAYLKRKERLTKMTSYIARKTFDVEATLNDLSKEDIIKAITQLTDGSKFELMRILEKNK